MENGIPLVSFFSSPSLPAAVEIFQQILFVFASFRLVLFGQNCARAPPRAPYFSPPLKRPSFDSDAQFY